MSPSVTVRLLATQSDARLVELARQGHERAFEALVQRHRKPLLSWCRRALLPDARAEDALQQALLQAWLALQRGDDVRDARAWLYRIVRNTALNARRVSGYDYAELHEALSGEGAPQEDLDRRIAVREALAGLAALPQQQREALLRTAVEGASHADAAAEMGLSEGALRGLVYRARAALRTAATAITPMPLASWAAGVAGHGGAVAELAVGGGSAGLVGLLAKGGAVAVTAGVLAAGVGTAERHRHHPLSHRPPARAAAAAPVADVRAPAPRAAERTARRDAPRHRDTAGVVPWARREPVSFAPALRPRRDVDGGGSDGGRSERDAGRGGPGPGTRRGDERPPVGGSGPGDAGGLGGGSGAPEGDHGGDLGSGDGGHAGSGPDGSRDGGSSGGDGLSGDGGSSSGDGAASSGGTRDHDGGTDGPS